MRKNFLRALFVAITTIFFSEAMIPIVGTLEIPETPRESLLKHFLIGEIADTHGCGRDVGYEIKIKMHLLRQRDERLRQIYDSVPYGGVVHNDAHGTLSGSRLIFDWDNEPSMEGTGIVEHLIEHQRLFKHFLIGQVADIFGFGKLNPEYKIKTMLHLLREKDNRPEGILYHSLAPIAVLIDAPGQLGSIPKHYNDMDDVD